MNIFCNRFKGHNKPVCLLQWLPKNEYRETKKALNEYLEKIEISLYDVQSKKGAHSAIKKWLTHNSNAQYLFIGAHGIKDDNDNSIGIGSSDEEFVTWEELWKWLAMSKSPIVLWLGACKSSDVARAWSPTPSNTKNVEWITSFNTDIETIEIERSLLKLLYTTGIDNIKYLDEQLQYYRSELQNIPIEQYYPVDTNDGKYEYVNVERIIEKVGCNIKEYLLTKGLN